MFSAITGLAVASGPLIGGAVVQGLDWQWIFWLNVPIALVSIPLVLTKMKESRGPDTGLDLRGLGLVTAGALGVVWALMRGNQVGWTSVETIATGGAGAVLLAAFISWERRAREPMLPIEFFRSRGFSAGNAAIFFQFASLMGAVFFFAQLLQVGQGYGPLGAGLRLVPWTATFITIAPIAGALSDKIGERPLMVVGLTLQAAGMAWLALIAEPSLPYSHMVAPFIVAGVGTSMAIPAAQNSVVGAIDDAAIGKAAGANSMMRELGGVFGVAIAVAVFAAAGSYLSPASFIDGFGPAIAVAAGISLAGAAAGLALPGRGRAQRISVVPALETHA
jgi:MFS family permease